MSEVIGTEQGAITKGIVYENKGMSFRFMHTNKLRLVKHVRLIACQRALFVLLWFSP